MNQDSRARAQRVAASVLSAIDVDARVNGSSRWPRPPASMRMTAAFRDQIVRRKWIDEKPFVVAIPTLLSLQGVRPVGRKSVLVEVQIEGRCISVETKRRQRRAYDSTRAKKVSGPGKVGVFRSKPSEAGGERTTVREQKKCPVRGRSAYFGRNQARPAASRAERTTVREHDRRRDREGIDRKTTAF